MVVSSAISGLTPAGIEAMLRVREIQKHPSDIVGNILSEKSVDLMTAIVQFLTSSLLYFRHGFFCKVM